MYDGLDVVAGTRAAIALTDAYLEVLGTCRAHLVEALAVLDPPVVEPVPDMVSTVVEAPTVRVAAAPRVAKKTAPAVKAAGNRKHDLAVVAELAASAAKGDRSMRREVAKNMGVSEAHAGVLIVEARKHGHVIPRRAKPDKPTVTPRVKPEPGPAARLRVVEDLTGPDDAPIPFDASLVAETYLGALRLGKRPVGVVSDRFNVGRVTAVDYIDMCRKEGALPPASEPQLPESERRALLDEIKPEPA